jgi:hypothetical protein
MRGGVVCASGATGGIDRSPGRHARTHPHTGARHIVPADSMADDRKWSDPTSRKGAGMATTSVAGERGSTRGASTYPVKGSGWVLFAGIMIMIAGVLNVIWGIAAIDNSRFFVADTRFILSGLNTWGWIILIIGALQIAAALSIWSGGTFGRWFGITVAACNAIGALLALPAYPSWSLAIFAVDVLVIYGLATYGGDPRIAAR